MAIHPTMRGIGDGNKKAPCRSNNIYEQLISLHCINVTTCHLKKLLNLEYKHKVY